MNGPRPPRVAATLLERLIGPEPGNASIIGDLHEEFCELRSRRGRAVAHSWYWWQLLATGVAYARPVGGFVERRRHDVRFSIRRLRREPGFAAAVVVTLGLAIGAGTAIFSVVDAVVLRPLPFEDAGSLVRVLATNTEGGNAESDLLYADVPVFGEGMSTLGAVSALSTAPRSLLDERGENPVGVIVARTSGNFFELLGITPVMGRGYTEGETDVGDRLVVISHGLWTRRFGGAPGVIGRTIHLDSRAFQIIGVLPHGSSYPFEADVWRPLGLDELEDDDREAQLVGRLAADADVVVAREEATAVAAALASDFPASHSGLGARVEFLQSTVVRDVSTALFALLGAVGLVLTIACVNTATLLLARAASGSHEVALRTALGASRTRIVSSHLTESLLLAGLGGLAGLLLGKGLLSFMLTVSPDLPRMNTITLDGRVIAVMSSVTALAGILFGVGPALHAASTPPDRTLRDASRSTTPAGRRLNVQSGLVMTEIALSTVLAFLALLLFSTFQSVVAFDRGFDPAGLVSVIIDPSHPPEDGDEQRALFGGIQERVGRLGGVTSVALSSHGLLERRGFRVPVSVEGEEPPIPTPEAWVNLVSRGFFSTAGIDVVAGRIFSDDGGVEGDAELVVNERFIAAHLSGPDTGLGSRVDLDWIDGHVVGVVRDVSVSYSAPAVAKAYISLERFTAAGVALTVRTAESPAMVLPEIEREIQAVATDVLLEDVTIIEDALSTAVAPQRFNMLLAVAFASLALTLAAIGIYGVTSFSVATRRSEIGIRRALGASNGRVGGDVARRIALLTGAGVAIGVGAALLGARFLSSLLYGVAPTEPRIVFLVALVLSVTAVVAGAVPVARAIRLDPTDSLHGG